MWTLYESILSLCQEHGIKGGKMCVDLGLSKSLMTDLKSGRKKGITAETAQKIADYFSVSVDRVLNGPGTKKAPTQEGERDHAIDHVDEELIDYLDELRNRSEMRMLFSVAKNANKQKIEAIVKFIEGLEEQK